MVLGTAGSVYGRERFINRDGQLELSSGHPRDFELLAERMSQSSHRLIMSLSLFVGSHGSDSLERGVDRTEVARCPSWTRIDERHRQ